MPRVTKGKIGKGGSSIVESLYENARYHENNSQRGRGAKSETGWVETDNYHYRGEVGTSAAAGLFRHQGHNGLGEGSNELVYAGAQAKAGPWGANAGAETGILSTNLRYSAAEVTGKVLSAGAEGSVSYGKVSGELKASLVEVSYKCGPFSATLGANVNTGGKLGVGGTGLKVLGTGGSIGTEGIEVSVLGSGFKIGN